MHNSFYVRCATIWVLYFSEMGGYIRVMDHNARLRSLVVMEMGMNGRHVSVSWRLVSNGAQTRIMLSHPQTFTMKMMYVLASSDVSEFLSDVICTMVVWGGGADAICIFVESEIPDKLAIFIDFLLCYFAVANMWTQSVEKKIINE